MKNEELLLQLINKNEFIFGPVFFCLINISHHLPKPESKNFEKHHKTISLKIEFIT